MSIFDKFAGGVKDTDYTPLRMIPQTEIDAQQRVFDAEQERIKANTTWMDGLGAATARGSIGAIDRAIQESQFTANPNWRMSEDDVKRWDKLGIREEYRKLFDRATSAEHLSWLESIALQNQMGDQELAQFNVGSRMLLSAADPGMFALDAVAAPLGALGAATRASRAIRAGLVAGSENAALSAFEAHYDPSITPREIAAGTALGFALGGTFGFLGKDVAKLDGSARTMLDTLDLRTDAAKAGVGTPTEAALKAAHENLAAVQADIGNLSHADASAALAVAQAGVDGVQSKLDAGLSKIADELLAADRKNGSAAPFAPMGELTPDAIAARNARARELWMPQAEKLQAELDAAKAARDRSAKLVDAHEAVVKAQAAHEATLRWINGLDAAPRGIKEAIDAGPGSQAWASALADDSMGAARVKGSGVAKDDAPVHRSEDEIVQDRADRAVQEAGYKGFGLRFRFSIGAAFAKSKSNLERLVGRELVGDSTGAVTDTATGKRVALKQSAIQHKEQNLARITGPMLRDLGEAYGEYKQAFNHATFDNTGWLQFRNEVGRYMRDESREVHPSVKNAAAAMEKFYADFGDHLRDSGVAGFENFTRAAAKGYLKREGSRDGIENLLQRKGLAFEDVADQLIGGAIKQARRAEGLPIDEEVTKEVSRAILKRMYDRTMGVRPKQFKGLAEHDIDGLKAALMENGVSAEKADALLAKFEHQSAEKSLHPRAKRRVLMDESYKTTIVNRDTGEAHEVAVSDLLNNDVIDLAMKYGDEMAGWAALSARADIRSPADLTRLKEQLHEEVRLTGGKPQKSVERMEMAVNHILGRSLNPNESEAWARASRIIRSNAFMTMMGQVGFTMTAEFGPVLAHAGIVNGFRAVPVAMSMLRKARSGTWAAEEANATAQIIETGFHRPMLMRQSNAADPTSTKVWNAVENKLEYGKRIVAYGSGLVPMMNVLQRMAGAGAIYKLMTLANKAKISKGMQARMMSFGLDEARQARLFELMRGKKNIADLGFENWSVEDRALLSETAWRVSHQMVFEGDFASSIPMMHSATGQMVWQFRGFMTSSWERHFLNSLAHYNDWASGMMFMLSTVFAGAGWTARAYLNTIGDEEKRKEMLTTKNIAASAFQQSSYSSFLPGMIDLVWSDILRNDPLFSLGRSTGNAGSLVSGLTPITMANKVIKAVHIPGNAIRDDKQVTQGQVKAAVTAALVPNFTGVRNLIDQAVKDLPKHENIYKEE